MRSSFRYPSYLLKIIDCFKKLPGVGSKSAERYAFNLLDWPDSDKQAFIRALSDLKDHLSYCGDCGALIEDQCGFCTEERAASGKICVTSTPKNIFVIEETGEYFGSYHVLNSKLSPLDGVSPEDLGIDRLKERIQSLECKEVILAIDSTIEGDATCLLIKEELKDLSLDISRLAFGLPIGSSLEFVDGSTLALAFSGRKQVNH